MIDEATDQLADTAIADAVAMISAIEKVGPTSDGSEFLADVSRRGPRVAVALREVARTLDVYDFDTEMSWRKPGSPTLRARLSKADAHPITTIIKAEELDSEPVELEGVLRTVSDLSNLIVELAAGGLVPVRGADLPGDVIDRATVHSRVRIQAVVTVERLPGGVDVPKYRARHMRLLDDD